MIYQKFVYKSIVYILIASLLFNTGISGLMSIMSLKKTTKQSIVEVSRKPPKNLENKIQVVIGNQKPAWNKPVKVTGKIDYQPKTKKSQPGNHSSSFPVNGTQYQILVRIIHAEAGGEPLKGQVAVAAVLLNRIRSGKFPKSISANVFRSGEFESVSNGYIWSEPTASAYKAAKLALQGWDPTYGALYFYNPAKTYSSWIWSRPIHTRIGNHYFAG